MRSSKSRSRSKQNRPRTLGNIINRVFDSSGPEGKVRGTPQQIIEKYQILARDAQLSNDRVAHENFMQHAEHYTRLLGEAQREMAAEQEARGQQQQPRRDDRDEGWSQGNGNGWQGNRQGQGGNGDPRGDRRDFRPEYRSEQRGEFRAEPPRDFTPEPVDVMGFDADGDTGLVETPEARTPRPAPQEPRPPRHERSAERAPAPDRVAERQAEPAPEPAAALAESAGDEGQDKPSASRGPRRPRGPRKPKPEGAAAETPSDPREAAE